MLLQNILNNRAINNSYTEFQRIKVQQMDINIYCHHLLKKKKKMDFETPSTQLCTTNSYWAKLVISPRNELNQIHVQITEDCDIPLSHFLSNILVLENKFCPDSNL